jgi:hypothetical protein
MAARRFAIVAISAFELEVPASKSLAFGGWSSSTPSNPDSYNKDISGVVEQENSSQNLTIAAAHVRK